MNRPYTICHILSALDGKITGEFMRMESTRSVSGEYGRIRVIFPDVPGVPEGFEQIRSVILDLIPCHLETEFYFRYITWEECEAQLFTWQMVEDGQHTWYSFELAV